MAAFELAKAVTSGTDYDWPSDDQSGVNISQYANHTITVTSAGSGVGTITANMGDGVFIAVDALSAPDFNTYLLPNCLGIKVAASVADIVLSIKSYGSTDK